MDPAPAPVGPDLPSAAVSRGPSWTDWLVQRVDDLPGPSWWV